MSQGFDELMGRLEKIDHDITPEKLSSSGGWSKINDGWYEMQLRDIEQKALVLGDSKQKDALLQAIQDLRDNGDIDGQKLEIATETQSETQELRSEVQKTVPRAVEIKLPSDRLEEMKAMPWRKLPSYGFHYTTDDGPHEYSSQIVDHFASLPDGQVDFFFNAANGRFFAPGEKLTSAQQVRDYLEGNVREKFTAQCVELLKKKNTGGEYVAEIHNHTAFHERLGGTVGPLPGIDTDLQYEASEIGIRFIESCINQAYEKAGRTRSVRLLRFPYGAAPEGKYAQRYRELFEELDLHAMNWTHDAKDFDIVKGSGPSKEQIQTLESVLQGAKTGSGVYLGHDKTWKKLTDTIKKYTGVSRSLPSTRSSNVLEEQQQSNQTESFTISKEVGTYYALWMTRGKPLGYTQNQYYAVLRSLNPSINENALVPGKTVVRIPTQAGKIPDQAGEISAPEALEETKTVVHTISPGDTLSSLARRYHTTISAICAKNGISQTTILQIGQKLQIDVSGDIPVQDNRPTSQTQPRQPEQKEVFGMNEHESKIRDEFFKQGYTNIRQLQYILATAQLETDNFHTMREYSRGQGKKYGETYYGRGYAQLTWKDSYQKYQSVLSARGYLKEGESIVTDPDIVTRPDIAAFIIVHGMMTGHFTGRKLTEFINGSKTDFIGARQTVNGTDKAWRIAGIARDHYGPILNDSLQVGKEFYVVQDGDTLFHIAKQHQTTVDVIKDLNGLTSDTISPGQRLKVRSQV